MRRISRALTLTLAASATLALGARPGLAQAPIYYRATPSYATPARTYVAPPAPRTYVYSTTPRAYAYPAPTRYYVRRPAYTPQYVPAPGPVARSTPFGRYRRAVDAGRDPNWASGRGVRLFKPWEY